GPYDGAREVDLRFFGRRSAIPHGVGPCLDLVVRTAGLHRLRQLVDVPARIRIVIALMYEQPVILARVVAARLDDGEATAQLLTVEPELELAAGEGLARIVGLLRLPGPPVPDDDVASSVLALGDDALEVEVGE